MWRRGWPEERRPVVRWSFSIKRWHSICCREPLCKKFALSFSFFYFFSCSHTHSLLQQRNLYVIWALSSAREEKRRAIGRQPTDAVRTRPTLSRNSHAKYKVNRYMILSLRETQKIALCYYACSWSPILDYGLSSYLCPLSSFIQLSSVICTCHQRQLPGNRGRAAGRQPGRLQQQRDAMQCTILYTVQ